MNLADAPPERLPKERTARAVAELGDSAALPRLEPALARALNRLHDRRAAPIVVRFGGRTHLLQWVFGDAPLPPLDAYRFRLGPHSGRLGLDLPALAALLGEPRPARVPRPLRCVLVADVLSTSVDALMHATRLQFEWLPGDDPAVAVDATFDAQACARFRLEELGWSGALQFDAPGDLDALVPACVRADACADAAFDALQLPLRFEIGRTRIRLDEVCGITPGDIVAIEEWRAAGAAVVVSAALGGPEGRTFIALAEGSRITIQQARNPAMNRPVEAATAAVPHDTAELALDRLDALEVTLRFEVGDLAISLGELRNVRAGHVFELGQPINRGPVRILAHGNLLGKGVLVAVGDRLGVRVSEFAPGEL